MKKLLLLINPNAGKGGYRNGLGEELLNFHRAGFSTTVAFTNKHGDAPRIAAEEDFSDMIDELCDRFGDPPRSAMMLCRIALVRGLGIAAGMEKVEERERDVMLSGKNPDLAAVQKLAEKYPGAVRMTIGAMPAITVKKPRGKQTVDLLCELLTEYLANLQKEDTV